MEFIKLLFVRAKVYFYEIFEFIKVILNYYTNKSFRQQDLCLLSKYFFTNPFTISKEYLLSHGAVDPYLYGETPLTTLSKICRECHLSSQDMVYELGCGRGRTCFWLANFIKCRVIGVEQIDVFVEKANQVKSQYSVHNLSIFKGNYLDFSFKEATVVYLYGTCLEEQSIQLLIKKFSKMAKGSKIITVSYPLTEYVDCTQFGLFDLVHTFEASFPWGNTTLYLHIRR